MPESLLHPGRQLWPDDLDDDYVDDDGIGDLVAIEESRRRHRQLPLVAIEGFQGFQLENSSADPRLFGLAWTRLVGGWVLEAHHDDQDEQYEQDNDLNDLNDQDDGGTWHIKLFQGLLDSSLIRAQELKLVFRNLCIRLNIMGVIVVMLL